MREGSRALFICLSASKAIWDALGYSAWLPAAAPGCLSGPAPYLPALCECFGYSGAFHVCLSAYAQGGELSAQHLSQELTQNNDFYYLYTFLLFSSLF